MRFQPIKCNIMQITRKRTNTIEASYTLEGTVIENVDSIKYLGVTITHDRRWNTHISNMCTKANRTLGFLRRNLYQCPQDVKEAAYRGTCSPHFGIWQLCLGSPRRGSSTRNGTSQNRAARFVTSNYCFETRSITGKLKWESFKKRRRDSRQILLYKGLKDAASIPTDDLIPQIRRSRNHH